MAEGYADKGRGGDLPFAPPLAVWTKAGGRARVGNSGHRNNQGGPSASPKERKRVGVERRRGAKGRARYKILNII